MSPIARVSCAGSTPALNDVWRAPRLARRSMLRQAQGMALNLNHESRMRRAGAVGFGWLIQRRLRPAQSAIGFDRLRQRQSPGARQKQRLVDRPARRAGVGIVTVQRRRLACP